MVVQIVGCAITSEACWLVPGEETDEVVDHDVSDTFTFLYSNVDAYLQEMERDFTTLVRKKRVLYSKEIITV